MALPLKQERSIDGAIRTKGLRHVHVDPPTINIFVYGHVHVTRGRVRARINPTELWDYSS